VRPEQGVLRLRKELNAFANLRPCQFASTSLSSLSPLKPEVITGTDFIIVRENCGGAYFGDKIEEDDFASDPWQYSREEVERVATVAAKLAIDMHVQRGTPLRVISCDKANVLASSRLWRRVVSEVFATGFPQVKIEHQLADSAAMLMMKDPRSFNGVVLMDNTYVDSIPCVFCWC
jgi:3-isopropylmalate dehydrogenase